MTGCTGTGPVGRNIVFNSLNFSPVCHDMTAAAGSPVRKVAGTQSNCMCMFCMSWIKRTCMAGSAVAAGNEVLTDRQASETAVRIVTAGTVVMYLGIDSIGEWRRITMAAAANCRCDLHQGAVVWCVESMGDFPCARMASGAVTAPGR